MTFEPELNDKKNQQNSECYEVHFCLQMYSAL